MNQEIKICQNCKTDFIVEPEDFDFYEKIKVPSPTWCPECRSVRRMTWRNERSLYKRKCEISGKEVITCFSPDSQVKILDRDVWWSDKWDPFVYGVDYDFNKNFFQQFRALLERVPMPSLFNSRCVQSDYGNHNGELKNTYLVFATWGGEEIMYAKHAHNCQDCLDIFASQDSELCYELINSTKLSRTAFAENSESCIDCCFIYGCRACNNCFGCYNLRNKSYHIFNQPFDKETYFNKIKEFDLGNFNNLAGTKQKFNDFKLGALRKFVRTYNCQNSTGDNLANAANCRVCFDVNNDAKDLKYCINAANHINESYDCYGVGVNSDLLYEAVDAGADGSRLNFDIFVWGGRNVFYSYGCHNSQNMFGCIGIHNKQYCILNKQYSKEEYEQLLPKIIEQMNQVPYIDKKGRVYKYGEFFPSELSPFTYNESVAQEYFPITAQAATEAGFNWKQAETRNYKITIKAYDLPDHIKDIPDTIV
ncbi:MAG: hypothetical protein AAB740_02900, partial [Patescibacteria group bacterium]